MRVSHYHPLVMHTYILARNRVTHEHASLQETSQPTSQNIYNGYGL